MTSVLFICTANQFRSPIAESYLRKKLKDAGLLEEWQVTSAGTWAKKGQPAHPLAVKATSEIGLDLSPHRSKIVSARLMEQSDLVIVMESDHKESLQIEFPKSQNKVILMTELVGENQSDVPDPIIDHSYNPVEITNMICHIIDEGFDTLLVLAKNKSHKK